MNEIKKEVDQSINKCKKIHPFQKLEYLVRDWQNFDDIDNIKSCINEMSEVLQDAFNTTLTDENNTREQIKEAFQLIDIFLLPHPGNKMASKKFDGNINDIDPLFIALLDVYVRKIFNQNQLITKKMYGKELKPRELIRYVKAFATIFKEGKLPKTLTLVQAISTTTNLCAKDTSLSIYKKLMNSETANQSYDTMEVLASKHRRAVKDALDYYNTTATFGDNEAISQTRIILISDMQDEFNKYVQANDYKMHHGLEKYVLPIIISIIAFIMDKILDLTCSNWSHTCYQASRLATLFYASVMIILLYEFYQIYTQQGSAAAGMGIMALGQAAIKKSKELHDKYAYKGPSRHAPIVNDIVKDLGGHQDLLQSIGKKKKRNQEK